MQRKNFYLIVEDYCALVWLAQRSPGRALPHLLLFPLPWNFFFRAAGGNMANGGDFFNGLLGKQQRHFPRSTTTKGPAFASNLRRLFGRFAHLLQTLAPHQLQPRAVYPQQHIRTPHLSPVRKILAGLLLLLLLVTDNVGKQSPCERAFRHPSVRAWNALVILDLFVNLTDNGIT